MPLDPSAAAGFCENLILEARAHPGTVLLMRKQHAANPDTSLIDLSVKLGLATPDQAQELGQIATAAVKQAGALNFSFSKGALIGNWIVDSGRGLSTGGGHFLVADESKETTALLRLIEPGSAVDPDRLQRLESRANVGAEPPHASILKIDEIGEDFGWLFAVTKSVDAWNLTSRLSQGPLQETEALPLMRAIAEALNVAHKFNVAHGGICPQAVLMNTEGRVVVTDFGVGAVYLDGPISGQRPGTRLGVLLYAAPELVNNNAAAGLDPRSDIFSLGMLVYDCLLHPTTQREEPGQVPWEYAPYASAPTRELLSRCLNPRPELRYQSLDAVLADIDLIMSGQAPGPLTTGEPTPPFVGPRDATAMPQVVITAKMIKEAVDGNLSEEDSLKHSQAGEDFLAAVAAAAPAPSVPDGYQKELFNDPNSPATGTSTEPPPATTDTAHDQEQQDPETENSDEKTKPKRKVRKTTGRLNRSTTKDTTTPKTKGPRTPTRRAQRTAASESSFSLVSLLIVIFGVGGLAGAAFGSKTMNAAQPDELALRYVIRAQFLASQTSGQFSDAELSLKAAQQIAASKPMRQVVSQQSRLNKQLAVDHYLKNRDKLWTADADLDSRIKAAYRAYKSTAAYQLIAFDEERKKSTPDFDKLAYFGQQLFEAGLPKHAADAFETALKIRKRNLLDRWKEKCLDFAMTMEYVPGSRVKIGEKWVDVPSFYMDRTEVTKHSYMLFLKDLEKTQKDRLAEFTPKNWQYSESERNMPISGLTTSQASAYADFTKKSLPSLAQYKLIATRNPDAKFPWGASPPHFYHAILSPYFSSVMPVGCCPAGSTSENIHDLVGNVAEIAKDEKGSFFVVGGSFKNSDSDSDSFMIGQEMSETEPGTDLGFRCVFVATLK